jgi:hypothetical protein
LRAIRDEIERRVREVVEVRADEIRADRSGHEHRRIRVRGTPITPLPRAA